MQKDIQKSKGETTQQKFDNQPSVTETTGHKLKEVGHDINAKMKENIGVGVGDYSSKEDRKESKKQGKKYEEKKEKLKDKANETKEQVKDTSGALGHKVQEIAHDVNASLKQNVGIGVGNYSSKEDQKLSKEHKKQYEKKIQPVKEQVEQKTDEIKGNLEEKKEELKEKAYEGQTGLYTHRIQEVGHTLNAKMKETIGVGVGDYTSEEDRKKAEEHWEGYQEKVKESSNTEVSDSSSIVHKIKEVAHNVNANLKEMIGIGVGNYSSDVDRELSQIHHQKYEEKSGSTNNTNTPSSSSSDNTSTFDQPTMNLSPPTPCKDFEKNKEKLEEKLFPKAEDSPSSSTDFSSSKKDDFSSSKKDDFSSSKKDDFSSSKKDDYSSSKKDDYSSSKKDDSSSSKKEEFVGTGKKFDESEFPKL